VIVRPWAQIHQAQLLAYMKLSKLPIGLLLNFNTAVLKDGIRRLTLRV
jgi:GxxExxY protein